jgi:copper chaperone NosL
MRNRAYCRAATIWITRIQTSSLTSLRLISWTFIALGIILAGCQNREPEPVAIQPEDMCGFCRMAISEKRYAAQFIDIDDQPFKFDDIGCMFNFIQSEGNKERIVRAYFVMDFNDGQWLKADNAHYVRSSELKTPMGSGIVAFRDEAGAARAVEKYHGRALRFDDLH